MPKANQPKLVAVEQIHKKQMPDGTIKEFKVIAYMKHAPAQKPKPTPPAAK